jgi:hypothetical protein
MDPVEGVVGIIGYQVEARPHRGGADAVFLVRTYVVSSPHCDPELVRKSKSRKRQTPR